MMHARWWKSLRWRLVIGSMLVVFVATGLLALTAMIVIRYYYSADQLSSLRASALAHAQTIGVDYAQNNSLAQSVQTALISPSTDLSAGGQTRPLYVVLNSRRQLVYPLTSTRKIGTLLTIRQLLVLADPSFPALKEADELKLVRSVSTSFMQGKPSSGTLGHMGAVTNALPYVVVPIHDGGTTDGEVVGVMIVTLYSNSIPAFVSTVGIAVFIATLAIAVLAAAAAILFARTITRPLVTLTNASRVLASGNYDAHVATDAPGELGELAQSFNDMAAQLKRDVEELRQQERWRRELIMNVTHDLATPLTAIAGLGEALMDGINQSREDYEATGGIIVRETLRLRRLVQDLHVMAKVEAGALQPQYRPVRLAALVDEVFAAMVTEFERHQVEPVNAVAYDLPVVDLDQDMLTRVFTNLCGNALRHTPVDGTVTVHAFQQSNALMVAVVDTGEGIPPEALPRVFERFFRADSARQSGAAGSGLGLAIVQAIIQAHGGTVQATNTSEGGACISFTLPFSTPHHSAIVTQNTHILK
ncbi:MAG TPA: HAMP domain-containing sensor histidine kinase [Dictyobacter sp.]|jgi:signal transduction histidine kinase|nr:HAMP domain-containing sensor histidine kinase [Dictyobacter sp.]